MRLNKLPFDNEKNVFLNLSSSYIPHIKTFINFWKTQCYYDESELFLEVSEILDLFHKFNDRKKSKITEDIIIEMLENMFEDIVIIDRKYIQNYGEKVI